jgi:predicted TIM-barrel fold metal-dependent hydrolase
VTIAYWRTLDIQCVEEPEARRIFDTPDEFITPEVERRFQDFMMAHLARKAGDQGWPFHIHTGWGNPDLALGNPALLCNFIRRPDLRKTRFVLFHGWPFVSEFIAVAKNFPQVSLDMVWLPFHSLKASEQFLAEMLDAIPCNKVTCGGDVISAEQCYGTAELLRDLMAKVLAERVADGYLTDRAALRIAHTLLHENAESLYTP